MYFHETWDAETTALTEYLDDKAFDPRAISELADPEHLAVTNPDERDHTTSSDHGALPDQARRLTTV